MRYWIAGVIAAASLAACGESNPPPALTAAAPQPAADDRGFTQTDYANLDRWLCHPDKTEDNACDTDLDITVIAPDNSTQVIAFRPAAEPAFDCFYIYPTVSFDASPNSDLYAGLEEANVIANQFARYGETCRLFAPMYRQRTLLELRNFMETGETRSNQEMRYDDVIRAWTHYLETENNGRGVILVGHSQGADMIFQLLSEDVLGSPAEDQVIAVHAIGYPVHADPETGGFASLPPCESADQTGCLITYVSFRAENEPPAYSRFGRKNEEGARAICTNPAETDGSNGTLQAVMPTRNLLLQPYEYGVTLETPFVMLPGFVSAECRTSNSHDWLAISVNADDSDARLDTLYGDVIVNGQVQTDWGLHLIDMNLAMGNLVDIAAAQGAAWDGAPD